MLPSGYIPMTSLLGGSNSYIDTGVVPSSDLNVELYFSIDKGTSAQGATATGYIFGARNSNSNTSQGQMNLYLGIANSADYVGWNNNRVSKTSAVSGLPFLNFSSVENEFNLCFDNYYVSLFTGATGTFTGTQNIHLFGLNNGGTHLNSAHWFRMFACRLYLSGVLIRDFVPVCETSTGKEGMYDLANSSFYPLAENLGSKFLVTVQQSDGGTAGFRVKDVGVFPQIYSREASSGGANPSIKVVAMPKNGYSFLHWEINGTVVSDAIEYSFTPEEATTIQPVYQKDISLQTKNYFKAMCINYDAYNKRQISFMHVKSASISEDLLQDAATTLECIEVPSTIQTNIPLFLYNPKGKIVYYGVVSSVEGNTVTCNSPLFIFNDDYLMKTSYNSAGQTVASLAFDVLYGSSDSFINYKTHNFQLDTISDDMGVDSDYVCNQLAETITENNVVNGKDYAIDLYKNFNIAFKYALFSRYNSYAMLVKPFIPQLEYDTLTLNDTLENIQNFSIVTQEEDCNVVDIYDSTGTTLKGIYGVTTDGKIAVFKNNLNPFIAYRNAKQKIVLSDDPVMTVAKENLNTAYYNHKITFDLYFNDLVRFENIHLGQKVILYKGDSLYKSLLTGISYEINENYDNVMVVHCTLGVVRTSLTAKLNLGKVKK